MLQKLSLEGAKWTQTFQISLSQRMAYKLHFVLLVIGPTLVFFFVKYNLWTSIFAMEGVREIGGYDLANMLRYQVWVMIVSFLAQSYGATNLAEDIRLGRISSYLIYPFEFWQFHLAGFLSLQSIQLVVASFTLLVTWLVGWAGTPGWQPLLAGTLFSMLVGLFWFAVTFCLGLMAFWLEETWVLRVMFMTVSSFLSGALLPLEIYPDWMRSLLGFTPFPYVTFVPTKIFMGEYAGSIVQAAGTLLLWTGVCALLARWIWSRGIRLYTAAGM
jgi:ABC-2 type transport system permease protein